MNVNQCLLMYIVASLLLQSMCWNQFSRLLHRINSLYTLFRTWWINVQCRIIWINMWSNSKHWYQCFSIKIIDDQCRSIWINSSQLFSMLFNAHWEELIQIDRHWWAMIIIEKHFRSMLRIWLHIDSHWSALHSDPSCNDNCQSKLKELRP